MAIKTFKFNYNDEASATFKVNTDIFTNEHAKVTLDFFSWYYNKYNDPIIEVLKKYAIEAIKVSIEYSFNVRGVISEFRNKEGFANLDGSLGLTLVSVDTYEIEYDYDKLSYTVEDVNDNV